MTISDLIAQLTRIMKETGKGGMPVLLGSAYNTTENPYESFEVRRPLSSKDVYLVPSDVWMRGHGGKENGQG